MYMFTVNIAYYRFCFLYHQMRRGGELIHKSAVPSKQKGGGTSGRKSMVDEQTYPCSVAKQGIHVEEGMTPIQK